MRSNPLRTSGSAALGLALGVLTLAPGFAAAAGTFYVDASSPNCSSSGPGTEANPYCSISAAVTARGGPGTTIYVKPGVYREQVSVAASGMVGSPFVIEALGGRVVVDAADDYSGSSRWTHDRDNVWYATNVTVRPLQVFLDGARLTLSGASRIPANTFKYDSGKKRLYVNAGGGNPGLHQVLAGARASGFIVTGRSQVQIRGITVAHAQDRGIMVQGGSQSITLDRDSVAFSYGYGIHLDGGTGHRVSSSLVSDNGDHGIVLSSGVSGAVIEGTESCRNLYPTTRQANGIYVEGSSSNRFERNRLHDNQDTGLHLQQGSNNNLLLQNRSWRNGDHGYHDLAATGTRHIGDVAWGNTANGFSVEGQATGAQFANCIATDNGLTSGGANLRVDAQSTPGFVSDYNVFWNSTAVAPVYYSGTTYATVAAYAAATGKDTHSFGEDPRFAAPASGDFHLLSGSRAIDSGNSGVANWPALDADGHVRVDDPSTPNTGVGPVLFADRGAFEYLPVGPPVAVLGVTPSSGPAPLFVTADGSGSFDPDAAIVSYRFDFGDGTVVGPQPGATATHTYVAAGTFNLQLTVASSDGGSASTQQTVTVAAAQPPNGVIDTPAGNVTILQGQSVSFTGTASDPDNQTPFTYLWDFGGGATNQTVEDPGVVTFNSVGVFAVTFRVTDAGGLPDPTPATRTITVNAPAQPPNGVIDTPVGNVTILQGQSVSFTGTASDPDNQTPFTYLWDFGGGATNQTVEDPGAVTFNSVGVFTVTFRVTDAGGLPDPTPATRTITVNAATLPPNGEIDTPAADVVIVQGQSVSFTGTATDPDNQTPFTYLWDFGGGAANQTVEDPGAVTFNTVGTFTVTFRVTDAGALADPTPATRTVTVTPPPQPPNSVIDTPIGNVTIVQGQSVSFAGSASDPDNQTPFTYLWDFGGGAANQTVEDPGAVTFNTIGTYLVTFRVTDAVGLADPTPATRTITVTGSGFGTSDQIHWTFTGQTSVSFDWRGTASSVRYGLTTAYGQMAAGYTPTPLPWSSPGPFWEARITGLQENTVYHYSIGGGPDHTFHTPPPRGTTGFTIYAEGDIGDSTHYVRVGACQTLIAQGAPAFVLGLGDMTYGNANGIDAVDKHFNDVQKWSLDAAYMPAWGNHEWDDPANDDLRNYKGRFDLPNPQASPSAPAPGCCGEDWWWMDYGNVRFIAYPEPYAGATWNDWRIQATTLMDAAQADPQIRWIVTFGHRPAYSSGNHPGESSIRTILDSLGATHSKYVLNLNGHSHNYERSHPQSGVVHITSGAGGATLQAESGNCLWLGGCPAPAWSAFRAMHHGVQRLRFNATSIVLEAICGPAGDGNNNPNDITCTSGTVFDRYVIGVETPDSAPVVTAPAMVSGNEGQPIVVNVGVSDPDGDAIASLSANVSGLPPGATAIFTPGTGNTTGTLSWTPAFTHAGSHPVIFTATNSMAGNATTTINVAHVDRAPVAVSPPALGTRAARTLTVNVTAADPDGDAISSLTMNSTGLPPGNNALFTPGPGNTTGTFTWTPTASHLGVWNVTFRAANALTGPFDSTRITVTNDDTAPVVTAMPPNPTIETLQEILIQVAVLDPESDPITALTAITGGLPNGNNSTFVPGAGNTSGTFRWTPTANDTGTFAVGFNAASTLPGSTVATIRVQNRPPIAVLSVSPVTGSAPLLAFADGGASSDPDGTIASYLFDFGDGVIVGPQASPNVSHSYSQGDWIARLTVTDNRGATSSDTASVSVSPALGPNLVSNPSFEIATTGWNGYQGATLARVNAGAHDGSWVARITAPTPVTSKWGLNDSPAWVNPTSGSGVRYRFTAWVRSATSTAPASLQLREYLAGVQVGSTVASSVVALSLAWQMLTADLVCGAAGSTIDFQVLAEPTFAGDTFDVDDISIRTVAGSVSVDVPAMEATAFAPLLRPNPVTGDATLSFVLARGGALAVRVFDLSGRLVRELANHGSAPPGLHRFQLRREAPGEPLLRPGVYLYRVDAAEGRRSGRFVVIR